MHDMSDEDRKAVFGEAILDELKAIREYLTDIPVMNKKIDVLDEKVDALQQNDNVTEVVLREHEADIRMLKQKTA